MNSVVDQSIPAIDTVQPRENTGENATTFTHQFSSEILLCSYSLQIETFVPGGRLLKTEECSRGF